MGKTAKRWLIAGGITGTAVLGYVAWTNRRLFLVSDITTGESVAYPHLRSRVYYAEPAATLTAAEQAIRNMPRWRVVFVDGENDALEAEAETLVGRVLDDVTVYCIGLGHGQTRVTIRSRSRIGRGDLGQNALHILELQEAMDARLTGDAAF
jgi:uncharacterized protein (DUF1499 family)